MASFASKTVCQAHHPAAKLSSISPGNFSARPLKPLSRVVKASVAQIPKIDQASLEESRLEYWSGGRGSTQKSLTTADWHHRNMKHLQFALAEETVPGIPQLVKSCDPMLGWMSESDPYSHFHGVTISESNVTSVSQAVLKQVKAEAAITPTGATSPAAMSLALFLVVESIILFSRKEYLGPEAPVKLLEALSFLHFSANASTVLVDQVSSLASEVQDTIRSCAGFEPSAVHNEMIVRSVEAHERAPMELLLGPVQGGAIFTHKQQSMLSLKGEESLTSNQAARLLLAWGGLARKYESFQPASHQIEFACRRVSNLTSMSLLQLEKLAGALAAFKWLSPSVWEPFVQDICDTVVLRLVCGTAGPTKAAAVLAVALHSAEVLGPKTLAAGMRADVVRQLRSNGLEVVEAELEIASSSL